MTRQKTTISTGIDVAFINYKRGNLMKPILYFLFILTLVLATFSQDLNAQNGGLQSVQSQSMSAQNNARNYQVQDEDIINLLNDENNNIEVFYDDSQTNSNFSDGYVTVCVCQCVSGKRVCIGNSRECIGRTGDSCDSDDDDEEEESDPTETEDRDGDDEDGAEDGIQGGEGGPPEI